MTGEQKLITDHMHRLWVRVTMGFLLKDKQYPFGLGKKWYLEGGKK